MAADRQKEANLYRFEGRESAERIRADADREAQIILAEAERDGQTLRGEGDAAATEIYAEAFGLEPTAESVLPHFLENNKIPAGFMAEPDDLAPMAALLCSPLSRFIVGQNIVIDGGQHASLF